MGLFGKKSEQSTQSNDAWVAELKKPEPPETMTLEERYDAGRSSKKDKK
jgi:hypothetical protein